MADVPTAVDAQGALSTGDNSNPAFTEPAHVGDVAYTDIAPPAGKQHPDAVIAGIAHTQLAVTDTNVASYAGPWGNEGVALPIGSWTGSKRLWLKIASAVTPAPQLILPPSGYIDLLSDGVAAGSAGSDSGASGSAVEIAPVGGSAGSESAASGAATEADTTPAAGSAGSTSGASGTAIGVAPVGGSAGSAASAAGNVIEIAPVAGFAGSTSGVTGGATIASSGPLFSETWDTLGAAWTAQEWCSAVSNWGATSQASEATVAGNLRLTTVTDVEYSDDSACASVVTASEVVNFSTGTKRVTFASVPSSAQQTVVVGLGVPSDAGAPSADIANYPFNPTGALFVAVNNGTVKVWSQVPSTKYTGSFSNGASVVVEIGATSATVKIAGATVWTGAHGLTGAKRIFLSSCAYEAGTTVNADFGDVTVEAI